MRVVVCPDGFGGTLTAVQAADAISEGWSLARPHDDLVVLPMSDGGEGLVDVVEHAGRHDPTLLGGVEMRRTEVADALGRPRMASWLLGGDGTAVIESAQACGLITVPQAKRNPLLTTTWGVGQLIVAAVEAGARNVCVGLGGSATVDGGSGALTGLGMRLRVADGQGLKMGGGELGTVATVEHGWMTDLTGVEITLLADVTTRIAEAATIFGPQKGANLSDVARLATNLEHWVAVVSRDLDAADVAGQDGSGAAGGLAFGLAAATGASMAHGATAIVGLLDLSTAIEEADLVVTGEGRLDATSGLGKVVGTVVSRSTRVGRRAVAVVGQQTAVLGGLADVEASAPRGVGPDPVAEVVRAAARLAARG